MPVKAKVYNQEGKPVDEVNLSDHIFNIELNQDLVHQAAVTQMANERQVLAHTKVRSEVRGGGRKPWRQKGTGRARAGSSRSPIWVGGGVTFGPLKTRNFSKKINRKMKKKALFMVLSDKTVNNNLIVLDKLELEDIKTKIVNDILNNLEKKVLKQDKKRSALILEDKSDEKIKYSARNLEGVKAANIDNINVLDLLKYRNIFLTKGGVKKLEERYKVK